MAERYAISSGNWVAARFDGGTLPGVGDTVHANGFAVTIDTSITVDALSTRAGAIAVAGGSFTGSGAVTVTADTHGGGSNCLTLNAYGQKQIGNSYGSTTFNARGTTLSSGAQQIGEAHAGTGGANRDGTVAQQGGILIGDAYGSADNNSSVGVRCLNGGTHIGDAYAVVGPGCHASLGSRHYGRQFAGNVQNAGGCFCLTGALVITTGAVSTALAKGVHVNGGYVVLQNNVSVEDLFIFGPSTIDQTLPEFPYITEGSLGFTGIQGTSRRLGT